MHFWGFKHPDEMRSLSFPLYKRMLAYMKDRLQKGN